MKPLYRRVGLLVGLVATAASLAYIASSWRGQDLGAFASWNAATAVAACILFYLVGVIATASAWRRLLADMGVQRRWGELAGILAVTQIGKYLPGNVAQHVGRASMALARGVPAVAFGVTVVVEMLLLALASVVVGLAALLLSGRSFAFLPQDQAGTVLLVAGCVLGAIAGLLLLRRLAPPLVARLAPRHAAAFNAGTLPSAAAIAHAFATYCVVYLAFGAGIVLMAAMLAPDLPQHRWLLVASFALAWIVGFVTPGAPAGLGVREGVMLLVLGGSYPPATAAAIVVGLRIATTLGDILLLPIGLALVRVHASAEKA